MPVKTLHRHPDGRDPRATGGRRGPVKPSDVLIDATARAASTLTVVMEPLCEGGLVRSCPAINV